MVAGFEECSSYEELPFVTCVGRLRAFLCPSPAAQGGRSCRGLPSWIPETAAQTATPCLRLIRVACWRRLLARPGPAALAVEAASQHNAMASLSFVLGRVVDGRRMLGRDGVRLAGGAALQGRLRHLFPLGYVAGGGRSCRRRDRATSTLNLCSPFNMQANRGLMSTMRRLLTCALLAACMAGELFCGPDPGPLLRKLVASTHLDGGASWRGGCVQACVPRDLQERRRKQTWACSGSGWSAARAAPSAVRQACCWVPVCCELLLLAAC